MNHTDKTPIIKWWQIPIAILVLFLLLDPSLSELQKLFELIATVFDH